MLKDDFVMTYFIFANETNTKYPAICFDKNCNKIIRYVNINHKLWYKSHLKPNNVCINLYASDVIFNLR